MKQTTFNRYGLLRAALLTAVVVIGIGCGPMRMGQGERAEIVFANQSFDQADVYASASGSNPVRLGTVFSNRTDTLVVPGSLLGRGEINIIARLLAKSETPQTGPVNIRAGERLKVTLPANGGSLSVLPGTP